ncbi:pirin family protein [Ramlibacter sp. AW1]|uniref:Pirin family protein n=1 Tax=Ramlibacter aurantiacus TaxID=2801330 RepID=A0A936ZT00_9BURK|nr:pirin family protein [Ramlibacter aurantiacus]MBL0420585.1 pirin family protein [Ramlibacter aurantiacus]
MTSHTSTHPVAAPAEVSRPRAVEFIVAGRPTSDGAGVRLMRLLTQDLQRRLDPFLMLDHFHSDQPGDYIAGFPDHPHRGFETITYMVAGRMRHRDSAGHEGLLEAGGVQWMTAGRGVIHSEIPQQQDGLMSGFQLWLNLPAARKMQEPWYRDFTAADLPQLETADGVRAVLVAGLSHGVTGAVTRDETAPLLMNLELPAASRFAQRLDPSHNAFVLPYEGELRIDGQAVPAGRMAVLANGEDRDGVVLHATTASRALLVAGRPLNEPIAQVGPFVMNTAQQIQQAVADFRAGRF